MTSGGRQRKEKAECEEVGGWEKGGFHIIKLQRHFVSDLDSRIYPVGTSQGRFAAAFCGVTM